MEEDLLKTFIFKLASSCHHAMSMCVPRAHCSPKKQHNFRGKLRRGLSGECSKRGTEKMEVNYKKIVTCCSKQGMIECG
jgi:hypothetical protein